MRVTRTAAALLLAFAALAAPAALAADKAPVARAAANPNLAARARPRVPRFPADVQALGEKLKNIASPAAKSWAGQHAGAIAKGPGDPETLARAAAQGRWPNLRGAAGYDALTFFVLYEAAGQLQASVTKDLDSTSELGETESLRLQMAMDRLSKLMTTLSNLLKKISDTGQSIVQNLK